MISQNETACWVLALVGDTYDHECGEGIPHFASQDKAHLHVANLCPVEALPREEEAPCWTVHCDECGEEMDPDYPQHWPDRASALQSVLDSEGVIVGDKHYCLECACGRGAVAHNWRTRSVPGLPMSCLHCGETKAATT